MSWYNVSIHKSLPQVSYNTLIRKNSHNNISVHNGELQAHYLIIPRMILLSCHFPQKQVNNLHTTGLPLSPIIHIQILHCDQSCRYLLSKINVSALWPFTFSFNRLPVYCLYATACFCNRHYAIKASAWNASRKYKLVETGLVSLDDMCGWSHSCGGRRSHCASSLRRSRKSAFLPSTIQEKGIHSVKDDSNKYKELKKGRVGLLILLIRWTNGHMVLCCNITIKFSLPKSYFSNTYLNPYLFYHDN